MLILILKFIICEAVSKNKSFRKYFISALLVLAGLCPFGASFQVFAQFRGGSYDGFALNRASCVVPILFAGGSSDGFAVNSASCVVSTLFRGGSYDGFSVNSVSCAVVSIIFRGGSSDGFAKNNIGCPAIFSGGSADGFAINSKLCAQIFSGGSSDGFAVNSVSCVVPILFSGGSYDGFAKDSVSCVDVSILFSGGSSDGFAVNSTSCVVVSFTFTGGSYDGFAKNNTSCAVVLIPFRGGSSDGFAKNDIDCPGIFSGGSSDGFAINTKSCTPFFLGGSSDGFGINSTSCYIVVPVRLLSFTANCNNSNVVLRWSTATETNNNYFTIESSTNAINWKIAGTVYGAGNSSSIRNYSFTDVETYNGVSYYRLNQTDFDGRMRYFNVIVVRCISVVTEFKIYPNPNNGIFTVESSENKYELIIIDVLGRKVFSQKSQSGKTRIDLSAQPGGVYFIQISSRYGLQSKQIIIKK